MTKTKKIIISFLVFVVLVLLLPVRTKVIKLDIPAGSKICHGLAIVEGAICEGEEIDGSVIFGTLLRESNPYYDENTVNDVLRNTIISAITAGSIYYLWTRKERHRK